MIRRLAGYCLVLLALAAPLPGWAAPFSGLYVVGDSLSDQGNLLAASSILSSTLRLPDPAHYENGRFSNGPVYSDVLAQRLGLSLSPSLEGGKNFAYGGSRTDYNVVEQGAGGPFPDGAFPWTLNAQIQAFTNSNITAPGALGVIFAGSNDVGDIIGQIATVGLSDDERLARMDNAIAAIVNGVMAFATAEITTILVPNVPDLGLTPLFSPLSMLATAVSAEFNIRLSQALPDIAGIRLVEFDTFGLLQALVADPARYGLSNVTAPCYPGYVEPDPALTECSDPAGYLFWDLAHPTTEVHALLAGQMIAALAIPEPATLPLILLGIVFLGLQVRRASAVGDRRLAG